MALRQHVASLHPTWTWWACQALQTTSPFLQAQLGELAVLARLRGDPGRGNRAKAPCQVRQQTNVPIRSLQGGEPTLEALIAAAALGIALIPRAVIAGYAINNQKAPQISARPAADYLLAELKRYQEEFKQRSVSVSLAASGISPSKETSLQGPSQQRFLCRG